MYNGPTKTWLFVNYYTLCSSGNFLFSVLTAQRSSYFIIWKIILSTWITKLKSPIRIRILQRCYNPNPPPPQKKTFSPKTGIPFSQDGYSIPKDNCVIRKKLVWVVNVIMFIMFIIGYVELNLTPRLIIEATPGTNSPPAESTIQMIVW